MPKRSKAHARSQIAQIETWKGKKQKGKWKVLRDKKGRFVSAPVKISKKPKAEPKVYRKPVKIVTVPTGYYWRKTWQHGHWQPLEYVYLLRDAQHRKPNVFSMTSNTLYRMTPRAKELLYRQTRKSYRMLETDIELEIFRIYDAIIMKTVRLCH